MRALAILAGLMIIMSGYAWQFLGIEPYTPAPITEESLKLQDKLDARLPVKSQATAGQVVRRKIELVELSYSIFIIGDDELSRQWLKEHSKELEDKNAIGFMTNVASTSHLQEFQQLTKSPLLPANVDDLLALFKESHYPLIFHEGEIWQ